MGKTILSPAGCQSTTHRIAAADLFVPLCLRPERLAGKNLLTPSARVSPTFQSCHAFYGSLYLRDFGRFPLRWHIYALSRRKTERTAHVIELYNPDAGTIKRCQAFFNTGNSFRQSGFFFNLCLYNCRRFAVQALGSIITKSRCSEAQSNGKPDIDKCPR